MPDYRNRAEILAEHPKIAEAFDDMLGQLQNVATQTNSNTTGQPEAPSPPSALKVTASQGIFEAAIQDSTTPANRGIHYFLEYSKNRDFSAPHTISLGPSRNWRGSLGNVGLYFRAHRAYPTSARSPAVYHGAQSDPTLVAGGGASTGPDLLPSQGSGTSAGPSGSDGAFGNNPQRSTVL